ncbi:MAG: tetratricopeptide repeat protein [Pseudomonadota bacterium]
MFSPKHTAAFLRGVAATIALVSALVIAPAHAQSAKELAVFQSFLDIAEGYMALVVDTHDVNASPTTAAVLQMQKMKEVYEDQGDPGGAVTYFRGVLEKTENRTLRNTAYMLLADLLKDSGRFDEAQAVLEDAIDESIAAVD